MVEHTPAPRTTRRTVLPISDGPTIIVKGRRIPLDQAPAFVDVEDARRNLGWSKSRVYRLIRAGALPFVVKVAGVRTAVNSRALARFIETGQAL